jgi:hypothetical protein
MTDNKLTLRAVAVEAAIADVMKESGKAYGVSTSEHLLKLAQTFEHADTFLAACEVEENFLTSDAGKEMVQAAFKREHLIGAEFKGTVPKTWSQAKSNIKQAWKAGIDPKSHETESALRKELNEKRKAAKPSSAVDNAAELLAKAVKLLPAEEQAKALTVMQEMTDRYYNAAKALLAAKVPVPVAPITGEINADVAAKVKGKKKAA